MTVSDTKEVQFLGLIFPWAVCWPGQTTSEVAWHGAGWAGLVFSLQSGQCDSRAVSREHSPQDGEKELQAQTLQVTAFQVSKQLDIKEEKGFVYWLK